MIFSCSAPHQQGFELGWWFSCISSFVLERWSMPFLNSTSATPYRWPVITGVKLRLYGSSLFTLVSKTARAHVTGFTWIWALWWNRTTINSQSKAVISTDRSWILQDHDHIHLSSLQQWDAEWCEQGVYRHFPHRSHQGCRACWECSHL